MPFAKCVVDPSHVEAMRSAFHKVCGVLQLDCSSGDSTTDIVVMKVVEHAKRTRSRPALQRSSAGHRNAGVNRRDCQGVSRFRNEPKLPTFRAFEQAHLSRLGDQRNRCHQAHRLSALFASRRLLRGNMYWRHIIHQRVPEARPCPTGIRNAEGTTPGANSIERRNNSVTPIWFHPKKKPHRSAQSREPVRSDARHRLPGTAE
jgi:hypothetical protein